MGKVAVKSVSINVGLLSKGLRNKRRQILLSGILGSGYGLLSFLVMALGSVSDTPSPTGVLFNPVRHPFAFLLFLPGSLASVVGFRLPPDDLIVAPFVALLLGALETFAFVRMCLAFPAIRHSAISSLSKVRWRRTRA